MNWHVVISNGRTEFHELWWFSVLASTNFFFRRFTAVVVAKCRPLLADGLLFSFWVKVPVTVSEWMGETLSELLTPQYKMLTWWWIKMGNLFHSRCALFILFTSNFTLSVFVSSVFLQLFFIHESSTFYTLGYKREVYSSAFIYFVPLKSVRLHPSNVTLIL